jgi:hypothetical protein
MNSSIQAEPDSRKSFVFSYGEIVFFFFLIAITKISRTELTIGRIYYLIGPFFFCSICSLSGNNSMKKKNVTSPEIPLY